MIDGLFEQYPSHRPPLAASDAKSGATSFSPPNPARQENTASRQEAEEEAIRDSCGAAISGALGSAERSAVVGMHSAPDEPHIPTQGETSWLGGTTEEQPAHHPSWAGLSSAQPPRSDYVPPSSQTEAPSAFRVIGRISSALAGTAIALTVAISGLLALYIYTQLLSLVATLATLPAWLTTIAVLVLGLLTAAVVLAFCRLAIVYSRLRRNEQIRMSDIQQLELRAQVRRGCSSSQQRQQARTVLEVYIREYPQYSAEKVAHATLADASSASPAYPPGLPSFSAEELTRLYRARRRLADPARIRDSKEWLQVYEAEFQSVLDTAADARVHQCAKWVGYKTAISPSPLVDTLIAVYWCFVLLRDLCLIYNVRVGPYGTAALLWRAFFTAYLAGKFQDWEDHADYTIESMMDGLPEIGRKIAGKLAAKAGDGLANYFMVRRLGRRAIVLLRPLAHEPF